MLYSIQTAAKLAKTWAEGLGFEVIETHPALLTLGVAFSAAKGKSGRYPHSCRNLGNRPATWSIAGTMSGVDCTKSDCENGGFLSHGMSWGPPIDGWFIVKNPNIKWMINSG